MDAVLFIRERGSELVEEVASSVPGSRSVLYAAGIVAVTGAGLFIGMVLGILAALMMGLIMLC